MLITRMIRLYEQLPPDVLNDFYKTSFEGTLYKDQTVFVKLLSTPPLQMFDGFIRDSFFFNGS